MSVTASSKKRPGRVEYSNITLEKLDDNDDSINTSTQNRTGRNIQTGEEIKIAARTTQDVTIDYPWYAFLVSKKSITAELTSQVLEIDTNYQASMNKKVAKFKAGKALADTVK